MRINRALFGTGLFLFLAACGGDSPTSPAQEFESIAGNYTGEMVGLSQGVALDAVFGISISQTSGSASGNYTLSGTLNDGTTQLSIAGAGPLSGTVASGTNPSVNLTIKVPGCPNYQANFSGAYDSANRRLTITGPVEFFQYNSCTVALSYQTTIILTR
jgi:hypothetical protein